jgi:hypothetical protein
MQKNSKSCRSFVALGVHSNYCFSSRRTLSYLLKPLRLAHQAGLEPATY